MPAAIQEGSSCALLGSGLTMLDVVMALHNRGYDGTIHVVSPRGLVPLAHHDASGHTPSGLSGAHPPGVRLRDLFISLRTTATRATSENASWQMTIDALRPYTASIWQDLGIPAQRQFLRHVRPMWDHHRHRVAPEVRRQFDELATQGRVQVHRARVTALLSTTTHPGAIEVHVRLQGGVTSAFVVDHVVNCTGPSPLRRGDTPALVRRLLRAHPHAADQLDIGLSVRSDMRLTTVSGDPNQRIFVLG